MFENLSIRGKYGVDVSAEIQDAKGREGTVLVLNLAADDRRAKLNEALVKDHGAELAEAARALAEEIGATKTTVAAPEGLTVEIPGAETVRVKNSLVLREESALLHIIETGELRSYPLEKDFPSEGLHGESVVTVDGETLLRLYQAGKGEDKAEKLVMVRGGGAEKLLSVKVGTKVSEVLSQAGVSSKKPILLGGVTGKFIPASGEAEVTFDALFDLIQAHGDTDCLAHETAELMTEAHEESCTKCVICREGTWHLSGIYNDVISGKGKKDGLDMVADIGPLIHVGSFCSFGQNMANVATTSAELNKEELLAHIVKKQCPAGICEAFNRKTYCIDPKKCLGNGDCVDECPEMAIEAKSKFISMIDQAMCTGCGKCVDACEEGAIVVNDGSIKLPKKMTRVGKF